jgi:hypothetical protein
LKDLMASTGMSMKRAEELLAKYGWNRFHQGFDMCGEPIPIRFKADGRGCNIPHNADAMTKGLASEGYWGY